jgi:hypothetical protein
MADAQIVPPPFPTTNGHPGTTAVRVVRMQRAADECWGLLPTLRRRILAFGRQFLLEMQEAFADRVEAAIVGADPTVAAWLVVDPLAGEVVGHAITLEELYNGSKVGWVVQAVSDHRRVPMATQRGIMDEILEWARGRGLKELFVLTKRRRPRAWAELYGFQEHRFLYRREVPPKGGESRG